MQLKRLSVRKAIKGSRSPVERFYALDDKLIDFAPRIDSRGVSARLKGILEQTTLKFRPIDFLRKKNRLLGNRLSPYTVKCRGGQTSMYEKR